MKKILLSLMALFAVTMAATAGEAYKTLTFPDDNSANNKVGGYYKTQEGGVVTEDLVWEAKIGTDSWAISNFNNNNWENNWTYIKCGSRKAATVASIATSFAINKAVTDVVVTIDKLSTPEKINSISLVVASDSEFANIVETVNADLGALAVGDLTFSVTAAPARYFYKLVFDIQKTGSNGIIQISKIVYNAEGDVIPSSQVEKPTFSPESGTYYEPIEFSCATATEGATLKYSVDGGETFADYTEPFTISESCEVEVYAVKEGFDESEHVTAQYIIDPSADIRNTPETAYTVAEALALIEAGKGLENKVYVKGYITNIKEVETTQFGNATYSLNDENTYNAETALLVYRGYYLDGEKFTAEDQIKVGDQVVVYGKLVNYNGTFEINTGSSIYSINGTTAVEEINAAAQENGQVYNLLGQPVSADTKGQILVKNGKKFINK